MSDNLNDWMAEGATLLATARKAWDDATAEHDRIVAGLRGEVTAAQERADVLLTQSIVDRADAAKVAADLRAEVERLRGLLPKTTRYGMNVSPGTSWTRATKETATLQAARIKATYGGLPVCKFFYGGALPARFMPANEGQAPVAYVCCKYPQTELAAGKHDAQISAYLDTVPAGQQVRLVNWQEPDDEMWKDHLFTAAQHKAATDHLCDLVHGHAAGKDGRAEVWECYMGWSLEKASGPRFDDAAVSRKLDGLAFDYYWNKAASAAKGSAGPLKMMADKAKALGFKRWALLETGDNPDTFPNGAERAKFWTQEMNDAESYGYEHHCYFNSVGTTGDHRLIPGQPYSDATIAALKARMAG